MEAFIQRQRTRAGVRFWNATLRGGREQRDDRLVDGQQLADASG